MSQRPGLIDWRLSDRAAAAVISGLPAIPGLSGTSPVGARRYTANEVQAACKSAIVEVAEYSGLGQVASPPAAELIGRRDWAINALATLAHAARPLEQRLAAEPESPGRSGGSRDAPSGQQPEPRPAPRLAMPRGVFSASTTSPSSVPSAPHGCCSSPRTWKMHAVRLEGDHDIFLRWVALHETAHVVQFERVGWLSGHVRGLAGELISAAAEGIDSSSLRALAGRFVQRACASSCEQLMRGELARLLADPAHAARLDRLQATMAVIEGHAEHVMDAAAADVGPRPDRASPRPRRTPRAPRRTSARCRPGCWGWKRRCASTSSARRFCDGVVGEAGHEALRLVWRSPGDLPDLDELEDSGAWLSRVSEHSRRPA